MRWRNSFNLVLLLLIAGLLAAGNLWFTARRSLIPVGVNGELTHLETRREKHPGHDDVFLIQVDRGPLQPVDQAVYESLVPGDRIEKQSGDRRLQVKGNSVPLEWSRDYRGMQRAMPLILLVCLLTAGWVWLRR